MSKRHINSGNHAHLRVQQRFSQDLNKKQRRELIRNASKNGDCPADFRNGHPKIYSYLSKLSTKRVKIYRGFVFIFNKTSDRLITMYELPEEYTEEYQIYVLQKKARRKEKIEKSLRKD